MDFMSIWEMSKRYITGAIFSGVFVILGLIGIDALTHPEAVPIVENVSHGLGLMFFYIGTILFKTWRQKKVIDSGKVLPERVESMQTAIESQVSNPSVQG